MARYPTPTGSGNYWAKLIHPSQMPDGEDWRSPDWEIVQVFVNGFDKDDPEHLGVHVPGIGPVQWVEDFFWGPRVNDEPPKSTRHTDGEKNDG